MIIGRKARNMPLLPFLRLKPDKDKCINCKICTKNCPMSLDVNHMVQKGFMENTECILCRTCVDGCPQKSFNIHSAGGNRVGLRPTSL